MDRVILELLKAQIAVVLLGIAWAPPNTGLDRTDFCVNGLVRSKT